MPATDDEWVAAVGSEALPVGAIVTVVVDGDEFVVWRGEDALVAATESRCPHAWTHLEAHGVVHGCELVCLTHFWHFDRSGRGTTVDEVTGQREERAPARVRACVERDGQVFVARRRPGPG